MADSAEKTASLDKDAKAPEKEAKPKELPTGTFKVKKAFEWADEFHICHGSVGEIVTGAGMMKMHTELGEDSPLEEYTPPEPAKAEPAKAAAK